LESLQESDVGVVFTLIKSLVDATVVELAQVYRQVQRDIGETLLPRLTNTIALLAGVTTPGDLERLGVVSCFFLC